MSVKVRKATTADIFEIISCAHDSTALSTGPRVEVARAGGVQIERDDALNCYSRWAVPTCLIVDGPYGLGKFPGEPKTPANLAEWYAPHVAAWSAHADTDTTLWFWCTEVGWAMVHPILEIHGWQYEECNVWERREQPDC